MSVSGITKKRHVQKKRKNLFDKIGSFSLDNIGIKEKYASIFLILMTTLFTSAGQLFMKLGAERFKFDWSIIMNFYLIGGVMLYCVGAVLLVFALKRHNLSFVYPFMSLNFVWVMLLSVIVLHESIAGIHLIGVIILIVGVALMRD